MKVQINHYVPDEDIVQQDLFEDVERMIITVSKRDDKATILHLEFKYGSENYKKFNYHCCGIYIDEDDVVQTIN